MSHVVTCEIEIKDLECLKAACKEIGLEFKQDQKTWRWYGNFMNDYHGANAAYKNGINPKDYGKCTHAIGVPGNKQAYEIGVVKKDGKFTLVWDFYAGGQGLEKLAGKDCSNLTQAYSSQVTKKHMKAKGYRLAKTTKGKAGATQYIFEKY